DRHSAYMTRGTCYLAVLGFCGVMSRIVISGLSTGQHSIGYWPASLRYLDPLSSSSVWRTPLFELHWQPLLVPLLTLSAITTLRLSYGCFRLDGCGGWVSTDIRFCQPL